MAGKRKTATKSEVFYIQNNPEGMTVEELANELGLFKTTIEKIILTRPVQEELEEEVIQEVVSKEPPPKKVNKMDKFITNRSTNGKGGIAVMQEAGSMRLDDFGRNARDKVTPDSVPYVTKTRPDSD